MECARISYVQRYVNESSVGGFCDQCHHVPLLVPLKATVATCRQEAASVNMVHHTKDGRGGDRKIWDSRGQNGAAEPVQATSISELLVL